MIKKDGFEYLFESNMCSTCQARCCKGNGYVFLDKREILNIAQFLGITTEEFIKFYTKKVLYNKRIALIDLRIKKEIRCVFLNDDYRCEIYPVRPKQCVEFPFWNHLKKKSKKEIQKLCPGVFYADK